MGRLFTKNGFFFAILGPRSLTHELIGVKFRSVKRTDVFLGRAKVHINR